MGKRASEQFEWNDRTVRTLKLCVAGDMHFTTIAKRLNTTPSNVSDKVDELRQAGELPAKAIAPRKPERPSRLAVQRRRA